ncbi:MAG: GIY-YIG nuclease family protein [Cyclobacteriaceae bacterium]|nr:GIY-YIG nuclease family protein [Cyclobacteriaceae bacterium]
MSNKRHTVLYTGITNNLEDRVFDHKVKRNKKSFTARYNCDQLVYFEEYSNVKEAIHREKQIKKYNRGWKVNLINGLNPDWTDLSKDWFDEKEFVLYKEHDK